MAIPYDREWRNIEAEAGVRTVWPLVFPALANLHRLIAVQTGGPPATDFSITVFSSKAVLVGGSQSSGGADPDGEYVPDPDSYQVLPAMQNNGDEDAPGRLKRFWDTGYPFVNRDGGTSNREKKIYVEINLPVGVGTTTWDLAIGCTLPD